MSRILPDKFPVAPLATFPTALITEVAACEGSFDLGSLQQVCRKLQKAMLDFTLYQGMPPIIHGWSVALVDERIQEHKLNRSSFEVDRIVQYLNQAMWHLLTGEVVDKEAFVDSVQKQPDDYGWLRRHFLDETLAIFMRALTEHALMENGGVQLSHGTLRDVRTKIGYHKVSALLEHWIPKLGDIKATPAHLRKPNSERGEDVW